MNFSQNLIENKIYNFNKWGANFTGSGSKENNSEYNWTVDNILSYKNKFGKHAINATFVYGVEKRQYEMTKAGATNFSNDIRATTNWTQGRQTCKQLNQAHGQNPACTPCCVPSIRSTTNISSPEQSAAMGSPDSGKTTSSVYFPPLLWHGVSAKKTSSKIMWTGWRT